MPPTPPDYGYGPVNYANQGGNDPFAAFDNRIRYNDMVRHQLVSQYQQEVVRPHTMTLSQAREVATQQRFQYGVPGGQDPRMYERQAELSRVAFGTSLAKGISDIGMWGAAETGALAMGAGTVGSMVLPLAATLLPMHFVNKGVQNAVDRRKYMHSIASDVEQYRDKLGFRGGELSYSQATELGRRMESGMSEPGQFFSREQQSQIHKIALSNNLISAKGKGLDTGTISQYEKNFKELIDTTEDVVKLLQTTTEGGMSVIKELQQKGFGNIKQIRQQIVQAKAFGGMTGIGSQNMMQLGAAGAQATQGTQWAANVGATMYQAGAVQAHTMAQSGAAGAYAVKRVGGTAAAGAAIGNFAMNMLQSGIGTKLAAYSMKGDGTIDQRKMNRMLSGKAGAYEIVTGANQAGYAMGENRVRFGMFKEDMLNQMTDDQRMDMVTAGYNAWSKQRPYSSFENKAYTFAGLYTNNTREQRLMYRNLLTGRNRGEGRARVAVETQLINEKLGADYGLSKAYKSFTGGFGKAVDAVGEGITITAESAMYDATKAWGQFKGGVGSVFEKALGVNLVDRTDYADTRSSYENLYGLRGSAGMPSATISRSAISDAMKITTAARSVDKGAVTSEGILDRWKKSGNLEYAIQRFGVIAGSGDYDQINKDFRITGGMTNSEKKSFNESPQRAGLELISDIKRKYRSANAEWEDAAGSYQTKVKEGIISPEQAKKDAWYINATSTAMKEGRSFDFDLESNRSRNEKAKYEVDRVLTGTMGAGVQWGKKISDEKTVYGAADISPGAIAMQEKLRAKMNFGPVDNTFLSLTEDALKRNYSVDYANILGANMPDRSKRGSVNEYARFRTLQRKLRGRFNIKDKGDQEGLAATYFEAKQIYTKEGEKLIKDVESSLNPEQAKALLVGAERQEAGRRVSNARKFGVKLFEGTELAVDERAIGLVAKARLGDMKTFTPEDFTEIKKYKDVINKEKGGVNDFSRRMWSSRGQFLQSIQTNAADRAKDSPAQRWANMEADIKKLSMVASGETGEAISVRKYDGTEETEDIKARGDREEEYIRMGRASRLKEEYTQKLEDEKSETYRKASTASVVKAPVLNYWNNRWVL